MAGSSVVPGVVAIILITGVNLWTIMILVEGAEIHQVFDLGGLLSKLPGKLGVFMQGFTNAVVWIALMGSLISYLIAIHDSVRPFVGGTVLDSRLLLVALASLLVLPLCFLDQRYLSGTSLVAIIVNIYLFIILCCAMGSDMTGGELP